MILYARAEPVGPGHWGSLYVPASPRAKLMDRGWVECLRCEDLEGCDYCLDGLAPPEGMVEAAAIQMHFADEGRLPAGHYRDLARDALLSAARWEREQALSDVESH